MKSGNRFEKGSGVYVCGCCGRKTRSTGRGDNEGVGVCAECYDMGGIENEIQDKCWPVSKDASIAEINALAEIIISKGGKPRSEYLYKVAA